MASLLYYIPGIEAEHSAATAAIAERGFGYAVPNGFSAHKVNGGPAGTHGALIVPNIEREGSVMPTPLYTPYAQTWVDGGGYWLGWEREHPPTPDDLARKEQVAGSPVMLGDGATWDVPIAVVWPSGDSAFPKRLALGPNGQWVTEPLERFRAVADQVGKVLTAGALTDAEAIEVACSAIGVNYRVSRVECSALGLLTTGTAGTVVRILRAFVGADELARLQEVLDESKKNEGSAGTADGSA